MTVRELIAELSKYPPDANVTLETCDNSVDTKMTTTMTTTMMNILMKKAGKAVAKG
jgi:hypothetical protein